MYNRKLTFYVQNVNQKKKIKKKYRKQANEVGENVTHSALGSGREDQA